MHSPFSSEAHLALSVTMCPLPPCSCHHCCLSPGSHSAQHLAALLLWAGERTSARLIFPVWRRQCCSSCRRRSTWGLWNWSRMQPGQAPLLREQSLAQQPSSWHKHTEVFMFTHTGPRCNLSSSVLPAGHLCSPRKRCSWSFELSSTQPFLTNYLLWGSRQWCHLAGLWHGCNTNPLRGSEAIPLLGSGDADRIHKPILHSHGFYGYKTFSILMTLVNLHKTFMGRIAGLTVTHTPQLVLSNSLPLF